MVIKNHRNMHTGGMVFKNHNMHTNKLIQTVVHFFSQGKVYDSKHHYCKNYLFPRFVLYQSNKHA